MKVLHIGGTGFLGSHIVRKLIQRNHDLTLITRDPDREMPFDKSKVRFIKGDVLQFDKLEISGKFDVLVYTAMVPFRPGRISNKKFRISNVLPGNISKTPLNSPENFPAR